MHVYRGEITSIKERGVQLDGGVEIAVDAILCGTGWETRYPFFSAETARNFGLPHDPEEDSIEDRDLWEAHLRNADQRVLQDFPFLRHPPPYRESRVSTTTLRLYNCIAPLEDDSIAFLGRAHLSNSFRTAEAQAIWTTAYFDRVVTVPKSDDAQQKIAYMNALSRRRYPSQGSAGDYLFFELVSYTDALIHETGLRSHRKGWWADLVEPCLATDFGMMIQEYRTLRGI